VHPKSVFEFYQASVYEALGAEGFQRGWIAVISIGLSMRL
jgi:hypothetical protein